MHASRVSSVAADVASLGSPRAGRTTSAGQALWRTTAVATLPERGARESGAPVRGERDQRRFEIVDEAPNGAGRRIPANHARLDLDIRPELLRRPRRRPPPAPSPSRRRGGGTRARARPGFREQVPSRERSGTMAFDSAEPSIQTSNGPSRRTVGEHSGPTSTAGISSARTTSSATLPNSTWPSAARACVAMQTTGSLASSATARNASGTETLRTISTRAPCACTDAFAVSMRVARNVTVQLRSHEDDVGVESARRAPRPRGGRALRRASRRVGPAVSWASMFSSSSTR